MARWPRPARSRRDAGPRRGGRSRDALPRFSKLALGCVVAIVATGAFQTWRQVGSLDALRSTDYGRILVVKLVLFAGVIVFAALSREIVFRLFWHEDPASAGVPAIAGGSDDGADLDDEDVEEFDEEVELRHLRRSLWAEIGLAMAVLAATALLVNAAPAKEAAAGATSGAVGVTLDSKKVSVDISAAPGVKGTNDVHVNTLTPDGAPQGRPGPVRHDGSPREEDRADHRAAATAQPGALLLAGLRRPDRRGLASWSRSHCSRSSTNRCCAAP